jgi:hypothetical protein
MGGLHLSTHLSLRERELRQEHFPLRVAFCSGPLRWSEREGDEREGALALAFTFAD